MGSHFGLGKDCILSGSPCKEFVYRVKPQYVIKWAKFNEGVTEAKKSAENAGKMLRIFLSSLVVVRWVSPSRLPQWFSPLLLYLASSSSCLPSAVRERKGKDIRASQRGDTWRYVAMHRYPRAQFPQQGLKPAKRESIPPPKYNQRCSNRFRVRGERRGVEGFGQGLGREKS